MRSTTIRAARQLARVVLLGLLELLVVCIVVYDYVFYIKQLYLFNNLQLFESPKRTISLIVSVRQSTFYLEDKNKISQLKYWNMAIANGWTKERRAKQAMAIHNWEPWDRATGPKS